MMKTRHHIRKYLILAPAMALLLTGCSKKGVEPDSPGGGTPAQGGDIRFEIGFNPPGHALVYKAPGATEPQHSPTQTNPGDTNPQTRVTTDADFNSTWQDGDQIGIFAVQSGQPLATSASGNYIHNVRLSYSSANGGSWNLDNGVELWFPPNGSKLDFYAYYPYDDNGGNPQNLNPKEMTFSVLTDQSGATSGKSNYNLSELLTAKTTGIKGQTVDLRFSHAMAMVQVELDDKVGGIYYREELTVTLHGIKPKAAVNLANIDPDAPGAVVSDPGNDNAPTTITMYRVEQPDDSDYYGSYTFRALVPAQTVAQGASLFRVSNGEVLLEGSKLTANLDMAGGQAETFTQKIPVTTLPFMEMNGGKTFLMGSSNGSNSGGNPGSADYDPAEPDRKSNESHRHIALTQDFYMSRYPVTNSQYAAFLNAVGIGSNGEGKVTYYYDNFTTSVTEDQKFIESGVWGVTWATDKWVAQSGYENHPVIRVSWYGAKAYADWVGGSLPTEAQWEYACRGGQSESLPFGVGDGTKLYADMANFDGTKPYKLPTGQIYNYDGKDGHTNSFLSKTSEVGRYSPNDLGLYDMHGNVMEWCSDWYGAYSISALEVTNPAGPPTGTSRVARGGAWSNDAQYCRSAYRGREDPEETQPDFGFRVVFVP